MEMKPTTLIIGPGGMKGYYFMGALLYLESQNVFNQIDTYVGVSVGAVLSLLLVAGYSVTEIIEASLSVSLFHDFTSFDISHVQENAGLISNERVKQRLMEKMRERFGYVPTLAQLYQFTGLKLVTVTLNIDKGEVEYLSKDSDPELSSIEAVMLSMNIPFVFYRLRYKDCTYVDGALGNPYPVDQFDDGRTDILGMYIDHGLHDTNSIISYFYYILHSMTNRLRDAAIRKASTRCKHLMIAATITDTLGLALTLEEKAQMIKVGYETAKSFSI